MKLVLLPGFDGTGHLFSPFLDVLPPHYSPLVISYPSNEALSYAELSSYVQQRLPTDESYVLVAESFSGPVAIQLAARNSLNLKALILCATFVSNPAPLSLDLGFLLRDWQFSISPPEFLLKRFLIGRKVPDTLVSSLRSALRTVSPEVLASRARSLFRVDVREVFRECRLLTLYIAGKKDKLLPQRCLNEMREIKPEMEVIEIEGPHFILQRNPHACFEVIDQFVRRAVE